MQDMPSETISKIHLVDLAGRLVATSLFFGALSHESHISGRASESLIGRS